MSTRLVRDSELCKRLGISKTTLWRYRKNPTMDFPKPIRLSANIQATDEAELAAWIERRREARHG